MPHHHQRIVFLNYLSFVSLGLIGGALGPGLPTLARQMNVGLDAAGGLVSGMSAGYLVGGLTAGPIMDALGRRPVYLVAQALMAISLLVLPGAPSLALGLLITFFLGLGQGSTDVVSHVLVGDASPENRGAALNRLHFFFAVGALLGPVLVGYGLDALNSLWPAFGAMAALILLIVLGVTLVPLPVRTPTLKSAASNARAVVSKRTFWMLAIFIFLYTGVEVGAGTWTYTFLHEELGSEVTLASWATSGFFLALTGGRLVGSRIAGRKIADQKLVLSGAVGAVLGALLLWAGGVVPSATLLIGAVLIMGFCCGPIYPTTMGLAQQRHADAAGTIVGLLTAAASLGIIFIPWLQGWLLARGGLLWGVGAIGASALALSAVAVVVFGPSTT
jgi:fucose permease